MSSETRRAVLLYHPESECAWWVGSEQEAGDQIEKGDGLIEIVQPQDSIYDRIVALADASKNPGSKL